MAETFGQLIEQQDMPTSIRGARAWRIRYSSRDVNGRPTESTGLVIAPTQTSPETPVLTWCHGTTGLGDAACPSDQPDPARELTVYFSIEATQSIDYGVPGLQSFIDSGWVVCATDYQGLGTPGMHHYIVNRSNARDAINIVHAARALPISMGLDVGCVGWSQGGGCAAAVAELDDEDYGDLRLIGTVPMSPGVGSIAMSTPSGPTSALGGGDEPPDSHLIMLLAGISAANPELQLSDVLTPLGVRIIEGAWNTQPVHHLNDTIARLFRLEGPVLAVKPDVMAKWKSAIDAGSAARHSPRCPVLMCVDAFDGGTVVPVEWQTKYAEAVAAIGGQVTTRTYPKDDHFSLPFACVGDALEWLNGLRMAAPQA